MCACIYCGVYIYIHMFPITQARWSHVRDYIAFRYIYIHTYFRLQMFIFDENVHSENIDVYVYIYT